MTQIARLNYRNHASLINRLSLIEGTERYRHFWRHQAAEFNSANALTTNLDIISGKVQYPTLEAFLTRTLRVDVCLDGDDIDINYSVANGWMAIHGVSIAPGGRDEYYRINRNAGTGTTPMTRADIDEVIEEIRSMAVAEEELAA